MVSGDQVASHVPSDAERNAGVASAPNEGDADMIDADDSAAVSAAESAVRERETESVEGSPVDAVTVPRVEIDHTPDTALGGAPTDSATNADVASADTAEASTAVTTESADVLTTDASVDDTAESADDSAAEAGDTLTRAAIRPREEVTGPRQSAPVDPESAALVARGLVKQFAGHRAVDGIDLTIPAGQFYGIVGPNGAGKTTTLSMIAGLLRPDAGTITVGGIDAAADPRGAKRIMGVLPDRFRTFDRLTGHQLLHYYGVLRGLKPAVVDSRAADLARAFDLTSALGRSVSDYSAGMTKKVMLAGALIHSPRVLILDEPFESVDPVSSAVILDILSAYVAGGGTVILSAHGMDLVERTCSRVAFIVGGRVLAEGEVDDVRGGLTLEERFVQLSGGTSDVEGLEWLHTFSD